MEDAAERYTRGRISMRSSLLTSLSILPDAISNVKI